MTDIGFPNNPALNELYTSGWSTWMWDGVKWMASVPSGGVYEPVFGGTQYPMYGFLYQKTPGDPGYSDWAGFGAHRWRFGISPGDDFAAGSIDYRGYVSDALSIVGAGATAGTRKINLYDNVNVSGNLTVGTTTILGGGGGIVSVGNITATGPLTISGPMGTTGSNAIFTFQDRTGTTNWGWYAQAGVARLWNDASGDRVTIDGGGSIRTGGYLLTGSNIFMGGQALYFTGVTAGGPFIFANTTDMVSQLGTGNGTFYWYNNPGAEVMRLDSAGKLVAHNEIHSQGSAASLWFQDRGGAFEWTWYSDSNQAKLYNTYGGVGRVVVTVDVNGQGVFAQGVYGAAFAINGTGHYIYDAGNGRLGFRAGGAAGPYGYANLGADSGWICGPLACGNIACNVINASGNVNPGYAVDTGDAAIELGLGRTGTGNAYIDFHAQPGTDFDFRIQRFPGTAGATQLISNGGAINFFSGTGGVYFHGIDGRDALVVFRSAGAAYLTIVPEYGTNQTLIGYYIPDVGWGSINLAGVVYLGSVNTGDIHCNNVFTGNYICMAGNTDGAHGPTIFSDATNWVFKMGSGNGTYYFANNAGTGTAGIDAAGNIWGSGTVNSHQFIATLNPQYRMINVNDPRYGSMWYNDGSTTYLLLTNLNDPYGTWNGLRPYIADNATGSVTIGNSLTVNGSTQLNGFTRTSSSLEADGGHIVIYNSDVIGFHVQNANGNWARFFDDGNPHIETDGTRLWINNSTGAEVYFGGPINVWDFYSRNNINCAGNYYQSGNYHYMAGQGGIVNAAGGGPFIYADGNWIIPHLGQGNSGFAIQAAGGNSVFQVDGAGSTTIYGDLHCNHQIYMPADNWLWQGGRASILQSSDGNFYIGDAGEGWATRLRGAAVYVDGGGFRVNNNDNSRLVAANGAHARWWYEVSGTRLWSSGVVAWGNWYHADESRGAVVYEIDTNGRFIFYSDVSIPNNCYLWFRDTNGSVRYGMILANDNQYYISDGNLNIIARAPNIYLQGYVQGNGNITAAGSIGSAGLWWGNNGGWWWTGSPIHTDGAVQCGDFYVGGCRMYNNSGYMYFDQTLHAAGVYSRGDIWNAGNINSGNDMRANGVFRGSGNGAARIGNWQGSGWDWMAFAIISGGYLGVSPDQGASGFNYTPNANWSDARLKLNIRDSEIDALAVIHAIPVRAFDWTEEGAKIMPRGGVPVSCGLVAQELEELIPSAVTLVPVIGDLAGDGMRCIIPEQLDPYYIRAIQQLADRVASLERQLEGKAP